MPSQRTPQLYNSQGQVVRLGSELKRGGEGVVYEIEDRNLVAKVYHKAVGQKKAEKLSAMVAIRTERLLRLSAWPVNTLHGERGGSALGFLMPKITNHAEIHVLYGVKSRLVEFPDACWPFLIQAAANIARAFAVVHEHGHVIGDVNFGGIFVAHDATVKLVDCDSFQVAANGKRFLCEVGFPDFTPPELQGQALGNIVRTPNHDAFGLAVIIFQLLFMGRHPFAGSFLGSTENPSLETLIRENRFAYGPNARLRQMSQPPGTLHLEDVGQRLATMFERAFSNGQTRPAPQEWVTGLGELAVNLTQCRINSGHYFLKTRSSCPWCEIETRSAVAYFNVVITGFAVGQGAFNIASILSQLEVVPFPGPSPTLPTQSSLNLVASTGIAQQVNCSRLWSLGAACLVVIAILPILVWDLSAGNAVLGIMVACVLAIIIAVKKARLDRHDVKAKLKETEGNWRAAEQRWRSAVDPSPFHETRRETELKIAEYRAIPNALQRKMQELESNARDRQKYNYLNQFRIDRASISGIGSGRKATLRSFGIETAADISRNAILSVPGFGATYTTKLMSWRQSIELQFIYRPALGIDPADRALVDREFKAQRLRLEQELRNAPSRLRQIAKQIETARTLLQPVTLEALTKLAQAQTDAKALAAKTTGLTPVMIALSVAVFVVLPMKYHNVISLPQDTGHNNNSFQSINPNSSSYPSERANEDQPKALYDQGVTLTKAGRYAEAAKLYREALKLNQNMAEAQHELGYALYKLKRYEDSIQASKKAVGLAPKNTETYRNLGLAYMAVGRWEEAVNPFQLAEELDPTHANTEYNLGLALRNSGSVGAAIKTFQKAVRLRPDYAMAHYELGLSYLTMDDVVSATGEYNALYLLDHKLADQLLERIQSPAKPKSDLPRLESHL
jgi:DNA-binding helix-hairpin-helix protein with protein kinase domain/Flp pilus assembly protein TadD